MNKTLENLIKSCQQNVELLLEIYFRSTNEDVSSEEIRQTLCSVSENLTEIKETINDSLNSM